MALLHDCVCIAQARVIAGRKREPHICTIAFHEPTDGFVRLCLPFTAGRRVTVKRWTRFSFEGSRDGLGNDTRKESWRFGRITSVDGALNDRARFQLHKRILSHYRYERELNESRDSIGVLVPDRGFSLDRVDLNPSVSEDAKELERAQLLADQGLWYPQFKVFMRGHCRVDGQCRPFRKAVLAWDVYESIRSGRGDPLRAIYGYRNPYLIIGNLAAIRRAFMVIGVLSAPDGLIERCAINQQLSLVS
jgi:hypothetical protein